ncbi:DUF6193 family natural product biosynthesis protein [Yinghuangia aomiensis]
MPISPDVAAVHPDIAAHGSVAALLRAETASRLAEESVASDDTEPLRASVASMVPWREPLRVIVSAHKREWLIIGTDSVQQLPLLDGWTDDPSAIARAALAWHDGAPLDAVCEAAPFVRPTGRYEVPDHDPVRLADSEWQHLRRQAAEMAYVWAPYHRALIEAAHANPMLRALYPFTSHWALRFSTTTRPDMTIVGPCVFASSDGSYGVTDRMSDTPNRLPTAEEAVADAARHLPSDLAPVTLGVMTAPGTADLLTAVDRLTVLLFPADDQPALWRGIWGGPTHLDGRAPREPRLLGRPERGSRRGGAAGTGRRLRRRGRRADRTLGDSGDRRLVARPGLRRGRSRVDAARRSVPGTVRVPPPRRVPRAGLEHPASDRSLVLAIGQADAEFPLHLLAAVTTALTPIS